MSEYRETIYRGRNNEIVFALEIGDTIIDASGITRGQLMFKQEGADKFLLDSADSPSMFSFTQKEAVRGVRVGVIVLNLGGVLADDVPDGLYEVDIYFFDAGTPQGAFWETVEMVVRDGDQSVT